MNIFSFVKQCCIALLLFCVLESHAQDIEVKKFEPMEKDQTATLSPRKDINGNDCALMIVRTLKKGMEFEGWVVGDVEYKNDAYYVYMANGAKHLKLKHSEYQTKDIVFNDFGIVNLKSGHIYELLIADNTKDVISKIYSLGWRLGDMKVSNQVLTFLNMSAMRGDKRAIVALSQLSVNDDSQKEFHWIEKLLEKGDSTCLDSMSGKLMYLYAKELRYNKEYTEASRYELKACLRNYKEAGNDFFKNYSKGKGLPEYKNEVIQLCIDSASVGNTYAMTCLGQIFERGICEESNIQMACQWYTKSFRLNPTNQSKTDLCRIYGNIQYPIDDASLSFIKKQAEEGLPEALFQLGCMYEEGRNTPKDIDKAIELFKKAGASIYSSNRHRGSTYRLAQIYYERNNMEEAKELLRGLYDDELEARYLRAIILFQEARGYIQDRVEAYNILSDLSKKGYQKATDFIKNNY